VAAKHLSLQIKIRNSIETEFSPKISAFLMTETHCRASASIKGKEEEEDEGACRQAWLVRRGSKNTNPTYSRSLRLAAGVLEKGKILILVERHM